MTKPAFFSAFKRTSFRREPVRVWLVVADLHCGSTFALLPPDFEWLDDKTVNPVPQNRGQKRLWEYWQDVQRRVREWNPDTVVLLADLADGTNRKSPGKHRVITHLEPQMEAAKLCIEPLLSGPRGLTRRIIAVGGSDYHGSLDTSDDARICTALGQPQGFQGDIANVAVEGTRTRKPVFRGYDEGGKPMRYSEVLVNMTHGASQAYIYQAMLLDRESLHASAASAAVGGGFPNFDMLLHGHWHRAVMLWTNDRLNVICPGFKCFEPYRGTLKLYPKFAVPDIGVTWLLFYADGEIQVRFQTFRNIPMADALRRA